MIDQVEHHVNTILVNGYWRPVRPLQDSSWWHRWRQEVACSRRTGHCYHLERGNWDLWWCCMCSHEADGMPDKRCIYCPAESV
jgi:hypothetical protein